MPTVIDRPSRTNSGLNQQTYQRLRLALSLNLRRQIFVAVCDDLTLRDRLADRLSEDLTAPSARKQAESEQSHSSLPPYPRLVNLHLNLHNPDPLTQVTQWLSHSPPPRQGNRRPPIPAFQILGIEHLTRESAATQRLFWTYLEGIERNLSNLESSLILWMPQPWFRALPDSAPEFWRCRTAVFEFVGDPSPLPATAVKQPGRQTPPHPQGDAAASSDSTVHDEAEDIPSTDPFPPQDDRWTILVQDLDRLEQVVPQEDSDLDGEEDVCLLQPTLVKVGATPVAVATAPPPLAVKAPQKARQDSGGRTDRRPPDRPTGAANPALPHPATSGVALAPVQPKEQPQPNQHTVPPVAKAGAGVEVATIARLIPEELETPTQPDILLQQIELLHQQQAPPTVLADAYRNLGNLYRDRIEQGDMSSPTLTAAIQAYEQVLVWLHETSSLWTDVLNDLGNLYWMLSRDAANPDQALSHLHQGIQAYQLALTKLNSQTQSQAYPMIHNNLGAAYADLARYHNPTENLQRSIQSYQQALRYRTPESDPQRYASTQNNLGTTYWNLAQHQQPDVYLKQAIAAYSEALGYYSPEQEPLSYAMIQNNLGTAYWNLAQHERPQDWLRLALGAYTLALRYRTLATAPAAFAATQNNLGTAYWHMANHTKDNPELRLDYLQHATTAYNTTLMAAAQLFASSPATPLNFDVYATHNNLGLAHYQLATDIQLALAPSTQSTHLETALDCHLEALDGWQQKSEFRQTALSCTIQTIRAIYNQGGLAGQNRALSQVPGHLLPDILPKL